MKLVEHTSLKENDYILVYNHDPSSAHMRRYIVFGQVQLKGYTAVKIYIAPRNDYNLADESQYLGDTFTFEPEIEIYYLLDPTEVLNTILLETI